MAHFLPFLVLVGGLLFSSGPAWAQVFLGSEAITDQELAFGGSFSPPTLEHGGIPARLMQRLGFKRAKMIVAYPYKKGAAPAEVSEGLTRIAVSHFDEVLETNSIAYRSFESPAPGEARWVDGSGEARSLSVDNYDILNKNTQTLNTLRYLSEQNGGAKKTFWVSGGDSFSSVPTWGSDWKEMFDHAHWIVISRPGFDKGKKDVKFYMGDPLRVVLGDEFINNYNYRFDGRNEVHVYEHKDPTKPGIYVINQPSLDDSSSKNRASLAEKGDREHAQAGLQPSVFRECVKNGHYAKEAGYNVFTLKNLEIYLNWLFQRIERHPEVVNDPALAADFREMSRHHYVAARTVALANQNKPWVYGALAFLTEHALEQWENVKNLRNLKRIIREKEREYRIAGFGATYVTIELFESFIIPAVLTWQYGAAGLIASQGLHFNEFVTLPAFVAYQVSKQLIRRRKQAGSLKLFGAISSYRNKLLRGDPEAVITRRTLMTGIGLEGGPITLNVVKSRLWKRVPLALRRLDDSRITWHDLNVSTNELEAMVGDGKLVKELKEAAGKNTGLYGNYLLNAVMMEPKAKLTFDLYVAHRYFKRLHLGDVPSELLGGFSQWEQDRIKTLRANADGFLNAFAGDRNDSVANATREFVADMSGDVYAVARALQMDPSLASSDEFWTTVIDLMATRYPGKKASFWWPGQRAELRLKIDVLIEALNAIVPDAFRGAEITYRGKDLSYFGDIPQGFRSQTFKRAFLRFAEINRDAFVVEDLISDVMNSDPEMSWAVLPTSDRGSDLQEGNLAYQIHKYSAYAAQELRLLEAGFDRAKRYLEGRPQHKHAESAFDDALEQSYRSIDSLKEELLQLGYEWARTKYPFRYSDIGANEEQVPGYADLLTRYDRIRSEIEAKLGGVRTMNHIMMGSEPVDLTNIAELRTRLGLRMPLFQRVWASCESLFKQ